MPTQPINAGATVYMKFTTRDTTGLPTVLGGSPVVSIYKDDSLTQSTTGVTLTVSFDGVVGLNHISVDTSADGTFYANGHTYYAVLTVGTVATVSVVGEVVGQFDMAAATSSAPTASAIATAVWQDATGADFTATGSIGKSLFTSGVVPGAAGGLFIAGTNAATTVTTSFTSTFTGNLTGSVGSIAAAGITSASYAAATGLQTIHSGTAASGLSVAIVLDSGALATPNHIYKGLLLTLTGGTGAGQTRTIVSYIGATKTAQVDWPWAIVPDNTTTFAIRSADSPSINASLQVQPANTRISIHSGTAQTGSTSNTIKLDAAASATDNLYTGDLVTITSSTGVGQSRTILSYNGTTKVATIDRNWSVTPTNTSTFDILALTTPSTFSDQGIAQAGASTTVTLQSTASATNSVYVGSIVTILSGTGSGQTREITGYVGSTKVATVDSAWSVNPDSTSGYAVIPTSSADSSGLVVVNVQTVTGDVQGRVLGGGSTAFIGTGVAIAGLGF